MMEAGQHDVWHTQSAYHHEEYDASTGAQVHLELLAQALNDETKSVVEGLRAYRYDTVDT